MGEGVQSNLHQTKCGGHLCRYSGKRCTDASKQKGKNAFKTRKSEKQAFQPTLDMIVYISTNYALNQQELRASEDRKLK